MHDEGHIPAGAEEERLNFGDMGQEVGEFNRSVVGRVLHALGWAEPARRGGCAWPWRSLRSSQPPRGVYYSRC